MSRRKPPTRRVKRESCRQAIRFGKLYLSAHHPMSAKRIMNTADFAHDDRCPRFRTWSARYHLPRVPLADALNESLRAGLLKGDQSAAYGKFMALSANPGLEIEGRNVYDIAVHHAQMLEVLTSYLVTDGPWKAPRCRLLRR